MILTTVKYILYIHIINSKIAVPGPDDAFKDYLGEESDINDSQDNFAR